MDSEMKGEEGEVSLPRASEFIDALISSTYCVRFFPVKWRVIREMLEQLRSGLSAAAEGVDSSDKCSELVKILDSVVSALCDARALVEKCSDESYRGGKLLLKSDVERMTSKIELQIRNLAGANVSRALSHSRALILSKPEAGASRDDMKFYLKDLVARLKISDSKMRIRTLSALNDVLREDEKYVRIMAAETSDGVPFLVMLLELGEAEVQEEAAEAISAVSAFDSYKAALVAAGALAPLIRVLEKGSDLAKLRAARALKKLTENSENSWSVSAHGGVSTLLKICGDGDSSGELIQLACGVLKSLSGVDEIMRFMVEEGAVSVFVKISRSKEESSKIQALEFLTLLASDDDVKDSVAKEDVVGSLVQVLDPSASHSSKAREVALRAIETLCFSSPSSMSLLMSSAFLHRVLFFLRNGETSVQESALKAVSHLCGLSEASKKAMGDTGFMPELVRLLEAKSFHVREMAAEALCGMISVPRNKSRFIQEDQNVNRILQLLNPEDEKSATKKFLLSAVASLTDSKSVRRKIVASGCIKYLEKLAETDVTDAKKIVKKLSGNRFLSILTGIWS